MCERGVCVCEVCVGVRGVTVYERCVCVREVCVCERCVCVRGVCVCVCVCVFHGGHLAAPLPPSGASSVHMGWVAWTKSGCGLLFLKKKRNVTRFS